MGEGINNSQKAAGLIAAAAHKRLFDKMKQSLIRMAVDVIQSGRPTSSMFGLIIDTDDKVWREYINLGEDYPPPDPHVVPGVVKNCFCGVTHRDNIQHVIDMLPDFEKQLSEPPSIGYIHVLVLASGMASPYTLHWGEKLSVEWDI